MSNLNTRPQDQSSFAVSGPCPTRSGEKTVTSAISSRFETGEDWPTLLLHAFTKGFLCFHPFDTLPPPFILFRHCQSRLSNIIENSSPLASLVSLFSLFLDFHWCAVPSPWCSCLKEPPELTCQYRQRQILTSYTGTKAATVGSVICHHHSLP